MSTAGPFVIGATAPPKGDSNALSGSGVHDPRRVLPPLSVYVLWHPKNAEGPALGDALHAWFGGRNVDLSLSGLAIPVHYRSESWTTDLTLPGEPTPPTPSGVDGLHAPIAARLATVRRPIQLDTAKITIAVALMDDNMVDDPSWRRDVLELLQQQDETRRAFEAWRRDTGGGELLNAPPRLLVIGVQLSNALSQLPSMFTDFQAIRLDRWSDDPQLLEETGSELRKARLGRLVTQALLSLLRRDGESDVLTRAFLSHAKADLERGPGVAERLRDVAAGYGQIDVFYDENSLRPTDRWRQGLHDNAARSGFIAVVSDSYASRYWCRQEVERARTPHSLLDRPGDDDGIGVWGVQPTVLVTTLHNRWSRLVPDLGVSPTQAWRDDRAEGVLDRLFQESLSALYQRRYAEQLRSLLLRLRESKTVDLKVMLRHLKAWPEQVHIMTWTPDPASLLRLDARVRPDNKPTLYLYPGHGFLPTEEEQIRSCFGKDAELISFEELLERLAHASGDGGSNESFPRPATSGGARSAPPALEIRPVVQLSAGDAPDVAALGYSSPIKGQSIHVDQAAIRLCRGLLRHEQGQAWRILYGGGLRKGVGGGYLEMLLDAAFASALAHRNTETDGSSEDGMKRQWIDPPTPLLAMLPWPFHRLTTTRDRARLHGLCTFYDVFPPGSQCLDPDVLTPPKRALAGGLALTRMRTWLAQYSTAAIFISGKLVGWSGAMPGIGEEFLCHVDAMLGGSPLEHEPEDPIPRNQFDQWLDRACDLKASQVRVVPVGEYGGMARQLVRAMLEGGRRDLLVDASEEKLMGSLAPSSAWRWLCMAHQVAQPENQKFRTLLEGASAGQRAWIKQRYRAMRAAVLGVSRHLLDPDHSRTSIRLGHGLTSDELYQCMTGSSIGEIRSIIELRLRPCNLPGDSS